MRRLAFFLAALALVSSVSIATTYVVSPDGSGDFPTIQAAIDVANDGDVIELTDGTFSGDGNRDIALQGKALTVRSHSGNPRTCIIDCDGSPSENHRGFIFDSDRVPGAVLEAITVQNGQACEGAGVVCLNGSSPTFLNCVFLRNRAGVEDDEGTGGGVLCGDDSSPVLINCRFEDNSAGLAGAGLLCYGHCDIEMTNCTFAGNVLLSSSHSSGGGICILDGCFVTLNGCTFSENHARGGGAAYIQSHSSFVATDCAFFRNTAHYSGVLAIGGGSAVTVMLTSCVFVGNSADYAGVLEAGAGRAMITRCVFSDNSAEYWGGALALTPSLSTTVSECVFTRNSASRGGAIHVQGELSGLRNCTLYGNSASVSGAAFYCSQSATVLCESSIIANCSSGSAVACQEGGIAILTCCDVFGNSGGDWVGCIEGQLGVRGNFSEDPLFCIRTPADDMSPFRLRADSPCLPGNHPYGYDCGLIGADGMGCGVTTYDGSSSLRVDDCLGARLRLAAMPNPFRGSVSLNYSLPTDGQSTISVFDIAGRKVWAHEPGSPSEVVRWDGRSDLGQPVAPGTYFVRLDTGGLLETRRVVLIR